MDHSCDDEVDGAACALIAEGQTDRIWEPVYMRNLARMITGLLNNIPQVESMTHSTAGFGGPRRGVSTAPQGAAHRHDQTPVMDNRNITL